MKREGPSLDRLTHRLAECPAEFLDEPMLGKKGKIHTDAVVHDLVLDLGGGAPDPAALDFVVNRSASDRNALRLVLVACWLFHDEWFRGQGKLSAGVLVCLRENLTPLAGLVASEQFVKDPDRREELARVCLAALGLRPSGETEAQAKDRLTTLDTVERARVVRDTQEQMKRARELRKKMQEEKAREAATKASGEW